ncbi:UDP-N-acetylglucosamine 4,6-dehydratase (inverting) [candidate division KSB1 bacterium]|nr:UDP-N-acetylglucosamine 4,6-dehydratase (inverting) [candidate division KSB1 bacterium]
MIWKDLSVLITGGTGSFGKKFTEIMLERYQPRRLIIFSRDELKQHEMRQIFPEDKNTAIRYFIGDVRDKDRLYRAFNDVDIVVHAAALKQVPTAEYNPLEVIKTNILGASNVIDAAIDCGVKRVVALSSDKAVSPVNLYGATKLCADKLFIAAKAYTGANGTRFSVVRYGNVIGSRGSVIPLFKEKRSTGILPITDLRMTRFWLTLDKAVGLVIKCLEIMQGSEIFVPKIPSMRIVDLANAIAPECRHEIIGIRPGEKLHEVLLTEDEIHNTVEFDDYYVVQMDSNQNNNRMNSKREKLDENFKYSSDTNDWWLGTSELLDLVLLNEPIESKEEFVFS